MQDLTLLPYDYAISMGARMRDARKALGESQEVFGRRLGVRKLTVINYEKGLQSPTAMQLFNLYLSGVDAAYIVFGTSTLASRADQAGPHARGVAPLLKKSVTAKPPPNL